MCLGVPGKIVEIQGSTAIVTVSGTRKKTNIMFIEDARVGDYVIVHAGFAIERIDERRAKETLKYLGETF